MKIINLVLAFLIFSAYLPASAHDKLPDKKARQITVSGQASLKVPPDKATIRFAINNEEKQPEKARERNEITAKEVLNSVRALGIDDKYMQLESLQINELKEYNHKTRTYEFKGYKASRSFVVELHELEKLAGVIAAVISNGSNELNDVEYGLQDPESIKKKILRNATVNAIEKADLMLLPLGELRGPVISINESSNRFIGFQRSRGFKTAGIMAMSDEAVAEPDAYAEGHIEIEASVSAVFAIRGDKSNEISFVE